jgi:dTDP-L-rhamnose 4-epimerase
MTKKVLITGGAGFIGSHLADELIDRGHRVRIVDSLVSQMSSNTAERPADLHPEAELIVGDIRDAKITYAALEGVDAVFHLAARVGVGQSMYEIADFTAANDLGTASLLEAIARRPVDRLVLASSMSIYGEGLYRNEEGRPCSSVQRTPDRLKSAQWDPIDDQGRLLQPVPTPETKPAALTSVYALNKYAQEQLCLIFGRAYHVPTVALRFFNVYGARQALSNPYTGVLAIFASRLLNGRRPLIFEDGRQRRDFIHVSDAVRACLLALEHPDAPGKVFNVGSGRSWSIKEVATKLAEILGVRIAPEITGKHRSCDARHCFADIERARRTIGFEPRVDLGAGLRKLCAWLIGQIAGEARAPITGGSGANEQELEGGLRHEF